MARVRHQSSTPATTVGCARRYQCRRCSACTSGGRPLQRISRPLRIRAHTRGQGAAGAPHLSAADAQKIMVAPVCVIVAYDTQFHQWLGGLLPARQVRSLCDSNPSLIEERARRNCSVQGAYLMIGARVLGLDYELISGCNGSTLDAEFFPDQRWKSSFLCNLGYASEKSLFPANPRPSFDEACRVA